MPTSPNPDVVIRELMLTVEYLRCACEHAEGRSLQDRERLRRAMCVGIRVNAKHKELLADYQRDTFWDDVAQLPLTYL